MNTSSLRIREMDEIERVAGWLERLSIEEGEDEVERQKEKEQPFTPMRRLTLQERYEETSPTDTSFSGASVFDLPEHGGELGSPCRRGRFRDDGSEATSCDDDDDEDQKLFGQQSNDTKTRLAQPDFTSPRLCPESLHSYDPISSDDDEGEAIEEPLTAPIAPIPRDPNEPRIVSLVSCLQCTLSSLPCSRTTPSCTRCIRNGHASTCLLLRRRFPEETDHACTAPVLLKLKNEDPDTWMRKMEVAQKVQEEWQEKLDKRNWVLPRVESERRGDWNGCVGVGSGRRGHPGEGMGRVRWEELVVETEMGMGGV